MARDRTVEAILEEWRQVVRKLRVVTDDVEWAALTARSNLLRDELQAAYRARQDEARELGSRGA